MKMGCMKILSNRLTRNSDTSNLMKVSSNEANFVEPSYRLIDPVLMSLS